jgi:hypothetical protein
MKMSLILSIITWVDKLYVMFAEVCPDVYWMRRTSHVSTFVINERWRYHRNCLSLRRCLTKFVPMIVARFCLDDGARCMQFRLYRYPREFGMFLEASILPMLGIWSNSWEPETVVDKDAPKFLCLSTPHLS